MAYGNAPSHHLPFCLWDELGWTNCLGLTVKSCCLAQRRSFGKQKPVRTAKIWNIRWEDFNASTSYVKHGLFQQRLTLNDVRNQNETQIQLSSFIDQDWWPWWPMNVDLLLDVSLSDLTLVTTCLHISLRPAHRHTMPHKGKAEVDSTVYSITLSLSSQIRNWLKKTKKQHLHQAHQPGEKPVPKGVQFGPRITDAWALGEPWHQVRVPLRPVALRSHQRLVPKPGWDELLHQKYNQGRRKMLKRRCQLLSVRWCQSCVEVIFSKCILIGMVWDVFGFSCAFYTCCFGVRDDRDVGRWDWEAHLCVFCVGSSEGIAKRFCRKRMEMHFLQEERVGPAMPTGKKMMSSCQLVMKHTWTNTNKHHHTTTTMPCPGREEPDELPEPGKELEVIPVTHEVEVPCFASWLPN